MDCTHRSKQLVSAFWLKPSLALALSFCLVTQSWGTQEAPPATAINAADAQISLLDGTAIKLRLNRTVSSADASVGQPVDFTVAEEVGGVGGMIVIPKGSAAMGKVTEAQPKRRMGRAGKLEIVLTYVRLADTETVPLRAVKDVKGKNAAVGMTVGIVAAGVLFFPAAPLFLLMKGKDITVPEGAEVVAYVDGDRKLDAAKFAPKPETLAATSGGPASEAAEVPSPVPLTTAFPPNVPPETAGLVEVQSNPGVAGIFVDGIFMSNSPATLRLNPGQHNVRVTLDGYKEWTQDVLVEAARPIHLNAELERLN